MLHWTLSSPVARDISPIGVFADPQTATTRNIGPRADHARMLAHAAKRRRAAAGQDGDYWKACAPAAVAKAAAIRAGAGFGRLP